MTVSQNLPPITVATDDYRRLMIAARFLADQSHPLAAPRRQELLRAELCESDAFLEDVVSLDRFVTNRLTGKDPSEHRALIHPDDRMWPPAEVSTLTPLGISLLGLKVGDRMPVLGSRDDRDQWVEVEGVGPRATGGFVQCRKALSNGAF